MAPKLFFIGIKRDGTPEIVWNWEHNMNDEVYPEYVKIEGPYHTRERANERLELLNAGRSKS